MAIGTVPPDSVDGALVLGELSLHGGIEPVSGVLPAAMAALVGGGARARPGPMIDRFDIIIEVSEISGRMLLRDVGGEPSVSVARRLAAGRDFADGRNAQTAARRTGPPTDAVAEDVSGDAKSLLGKAIETQSLSASGFHRVLRMACIIADLERSSNIQRQRLAEVLAYRAMPLLA